MQWLNAHHELSPITRHALVVLESIDAVDLAFDTFVCALLDGETDTSGYPEYNAIVGGVASHWDEATGDMIVRGVVGWGGRGVRGDTDRIAQPDPRRAADEHPRQPVRDGPDGGRAAGPGRRARRPRVRPLRLRVGPRARVLLPQVRDAPAPRLIATTPMPIYEYLCTACDHRADILHGINDPGPQFCPSCGREGTMRKQFAPPTIHFKGSGWAKKDRGQHELDASREARSRRRANRAGRRRLEGRHDGWRRPDVGSRRGKSDVGAGSVREGIGLRRARPAPTPPAPARRFRLVEVGLSSSDGR